MHSRLEEVAARFGSRPALISMASVSDYFGDSAPYRIEEGGIAMIDISGPLSNDKWSWGGTTYPEIQDACKIAKADPNVKGVLLTINSPGGATDNAFETAACIASLAAVKPVYAVASTMAYSAAYLLACQAETIYCCPTSGGVGSIGVWAAHMDLSEMLKKAGIKPTLISAGEGKTDGNPYEPLSDAGKLKIQADVDRLYGEFVGAVAIDRKISAVDVVKLGARTYEGAKAAISSGLADMSGDVTDAWTALCLAVEQDDEEEDGKYPLMRGSNKSSVASATNSKEKNMAEVKTTADVTQAAAAAVVPAPTAAEIQTLVSEARASGIAEAGLIADMCALAGTPEKAADFFRQKKTVAEVTSALLADKVAADAKVVDAAVNVNPAKASAETTEFGTAKPWSEIAAQISGGKVRK